MTVEPATTFACPVCRHPLWTGSGPAARCMNEHSFDFARNYYNLLLVQHKTSRDPGDTAEMVKARARLLATGVYASIAHAVSDAVYGLAERHHAVPLYSVVDAGCGEGYYLQAVAERLAGNEVSATLAGTDVSKWAVRTAAKRKVPVAWAVANNRYLPFMSGSVDLILCLFGFPVWQGFRDVQKLGGRVLLVDPGPDHLAELRAVIYPTVKRSDLAGLGAAIAAGYHLEQMVEVRASGRLGSKAEIADLLAMTPHDHRAQQAGRDALAQLNELTVTIDVAIRILRLADNRTSSLDA